MLADDALSVVNRLAESIEHVEGEAASFSSRRRHTRLQGDLSSDVCSSDLNFRTGAAWPVGRAANPGVGLIIMPGRMPAIWAGQGDAAAGVTGPVSIRSGARGMRRSRRIRCEQRG